MTIRAATVDDLDTINQIYNYYIENTSITFDYVAWSLAQRKAWFEKILHNSDIYHVLVKEDANGNVIGFAYNNEFREKLAYRVSTELTIYMSHNQGAKGAGSELMESLLAKISSTDVHRIYSVITLPNPASIKLHEKFGFKQVGVLSEAGYKFEQFHSVAILEKEI